MFKKILIAVTLLVLTTSCVSKKIFTDLETKFADLKKENRKLEDHTDSLSKIKNQLDLDKTSLQTELEKIKAERNQLLADFNAADKNLKTLQGSYKALEKNSNEALQANLEKNRNLLTQLEAKEKTIATEQDRLNKLKADLEASSKRLNELESLIAAKEEGLKKLKETLSKSLKAFEGKGLTVQHKNGKVYVSVENKLLFQTGSWAVGEEGRKAVVLVANVLAENPDISVLIEGHTDTDKFAGAVGQIENNWDLSTKRATAIVNILSENKSVNKQNLTAAGRGEYAPVASNDTPEGKSKNRRIEIILTPKLDEISKMLNDL